MYDTSGAVDERGYYDVRVNVMVTLRFTDVDDMEVSDLGGQNVINELRLERQAASVRRTCAAHEAGVETTSSHRGRGYAAHIATAVGAGGTWRGKSRYTAHRGRTTRRALSRASSPDPLRERPAHHLRVRWQRPFDSPFGVWKVSRRRRY